MVDKLKLTFTHILSLVIVVLTFVVVVLLFFVEPPQENKEAINLCVGFILGTGMGAVLNYYLGSSQGSATKGDILEKMAEKQIDATLQENKEMKEEARN